MADVSLSAVSRIVMAVETRHGLRLVLMRGLAGMHHDPIMALQAAETIIEAIREYPTIEMTLEGLRAMTVLTCRSRVCVDQCLELLVSTLKHDVRRGLRLQASRCLEQLSPTDYILWAVPIGDLPHPFSRHPSRHSLLSFSSLQHAFDSIAHSRHAVLVHYSMLSSAAACRDGQA